jgi:hypothetical protein
MANLLDDVYLQLPRKNLQYVSNDYRKIVSMEYDELRHAIDMMDERLKTIRVVCFNRRRTHVVQSKTKTQKKTATKTQHKSVSDSKVSASCWVDANGYRTRTPPDQVKQTNDDSYDEYLACYYEQYGNQKIPHYVTIEEKDYYTYPSNVNTSREPFSTVPSNVVPSHVIDSTKPKEPVLSKEEILTRQKELVTRLVEKRQEQTHLIDFKSKIKSYTNNIQKITMVKSPDYISDPTERFIQQCTYVEQLFKYILDHAEYLSQCETLRSQQKHSYSFIQTCIRKCIEFTEEINTKYDAIRKQTTRSNLALRSAKTTCLSVMNDAKLELSKKYVSNKVEPESLEHVLKTPIVIK